MRAAATLGMRHPLLWINDPGMAGARRALGLADRCTTSPTTGSPPTARPPSSSGPPRTRRCLLDARARGRRVLARAGPPQGRDAGRWCSSRTPSTSRRTAAPPPRPADLPGGPVALYLGTVHPDRIDVDLCEATARALGTAGTLVLVGPNLLAPTRRSGWSAPGARCSAPGARDEVVGYLQHADVLVVPHVVTAVHRQPRPDQALRVPGGRPARCVSTAGGRVPRRRRPAHHDRRRRRVRGRGRRRRAGAHEVPGRRGRRGADWAERVAAMAAVLARVAAGRA